MKTGGKGKGKNGKSKGTDKGIKGKRSEGTESLLGTRNTVNCWRPGNSGPCARGGRSIAHVGECGTGADDWTWNAPQLKELQLEPETGSTIGGLWLLLVSLTHSNVQS